MNWMDFLVIGLLLGSLYFGWKRGFIVAAIECVKWIASIVLAKLFHVTFTNFLIRIFGDPREKISEHVNNYLFNLLNFDRSTPKTIEPSAFNQNIEFLKLPPEFEMRIREELSEKVVNTTTGFVDVVTTHMSEMILYGLGFIIMVLVLLSLFGFVQFVGSILSKLPLIKTFNQGGGLLLGGVIGLAIVYLMMTGITFFRAFGWAQDAIIAVESSKYAIYFYKYNIFEYVFIQMLMQRY